MPATAERRGKLRGAACFTGLGSRRTQFDVQAGLGSKGSNVVAFCAPARGGSAIALASPFELANSQIV